MNAVVIVTFDHTLSANQLDGLAMEFAEHVKPTINGLLWKIFVKNDRNRSAGIYLFTNLQAAENYANGPFIEEMRNAPAIHNVTAEVFTTMDAASLEADAPLSASND